MYKKADVAHDILVLLLVCKTEICKFLYEHVHFDMSGKDGNMLIRFL